MKAAVHEIPFARPEFDDAEAQAVAEVLSSGWVSQGPRVARFEEMFAERVGARCAVATSSCTTALHLALVLAGVGPGDEVICPSYTFIATANAVLYTGARPVFADIEPDTWNINPDDAFGRLSPRTKAIIPVHQVGLAADLDRLTPFAARGVSIVEDAACAVGSTYRGRPIGSHGNLGCFSFHPRKTISTGEGGMLTTGDPEIAERARALRSHGASVSTLSRHQAKGPCSRVSLLQLPHVGCARGDRQRQLGSGRATAKRRAIADDTREAPLGVVHAPPRPAYAGHAHQSHGLP